MVEYPPYVFAHGKIKALFEKIREAAVPQKFTQDFLATSLGFKSSSDRAFPSLLKRLDFIDTANVPTQAYKEYRDKTRSRQVMAERLRAAYPELFKANEYAYKLGKSELTETIKQLTGLAEKDNILNPIVGTFSALKELANFESGMATTPEPIEKPAELATSSEAADKIKLGMSYTIVLNLPATTDVAVFNAIFKSLKENILNE